MSFFLDFRSGVDVVSFLVGCVVESVGKWCPAFRGNLMVSSSKPEMYLLVTFRPLKVQILIIRKRRWLIT